jgi:uncharacterized protein (DUF486 family)
MSLSDTVADLLRYFHVPFGTTLHFYGDKEKKRLLFKGTNSTLCLKTIRFGARIVYVAVIPQEQSIELILQPIQTTKHITVPLSATIGDIIRQAAGFLEGSCRNGCYGVRLLEKSEFLPIGSVLADLSKIPTALWISPGGVADISGVYLTFTSSGGTIDPLPQLRLSGTSIPTKIDLLLPPNDSLQQLDVLSSDTIGNILKQSKRFLMMEVQCESGSFGASLDDDFEFLPLDSTLASFSKPIVDLWIRTVKFSQEHTIYLDLLRKKKTFEPRTIQLKLPPDQTVENITVLATETINDILNQCETFLKKQKCKSGFYGVSLNDDSEFLPLDSVFSDFGELPEVLFLRYEENSQLQTVYFRLNPLEKVDLVSVNQWGILYSDEIIQIPRNRIVHLCVEFKGTITDFEVDQETTFGTFREFFVREKVADITKLTFLHEGVPILDSDRLANCVPKISVEWKVDVKPLDYADKVKELLKLAQIKQFDISIRTVRRCYNSCGYDFNAACCKLGLRGD